MLDAAQALVLEKGAGALTLDALARRGGMSKGGVMYHFPTKQALLVALGARMIAHNQACHEEIRACLPDKPGREMRAYVANSTRETDAEYQVSGALLAVLHGAPSLLRTAKDFFDARFAQLIADQPFEQAALVYLATEGLWLLEILNISPLTSAQRALVVKRLLELSAPSPAAGKRKSPRAKVSTRSTRT